jgi:cytochrome c oxidase subunit 4
MSQQRLETPRAYVAIFAVLIALTAATVALSRVDLGVWHGSAGLGIACAKAMLIVLFFMHLWRSSRVTWVIALAGLFWLGLLVGLTMTDVLTRGWPLG